MRQLQDRCDTPAADRLDEALRTAFTRDRAFISRPLASRHADASGRPDCSYKGARPASSGDRRRRAGVPDYDGNGMFRSLGNVLVSPAVALLFIDFERPNRLRVNGSARMVDADPLLAGFRGRSSSFGCARRVFRTARAHPSHDDCRDLALRSRRSTRRRSRRETLRRLRRRVAEQRSGTHHE
jgi:hypothetical protein